MATRAIHQFASQLLMADWERFKPIAIIIGPVTMGGKYFITLPVPKALINAARIRYNTPEHATPKHAYGSSPASPFGAIAQYPARNAKDEPKNAGTLPFARKWNRNVPSPANSNVVDTLSPVNAGTNTVAPNIANICCIPKISILGTPNCLASKMPSSPITVF